MNNNVIRKGPIEISLNYNFTPVKVRLTYPISKSFIKESFPNIEAFEIKLNCMRGKFFRLKARWYYTTEALVEKDFQDTYNYMIDELARIKHMTGCHKRIGKYWDKSFLMVSYHCALNKAV